MPEPGPYGPLPASYPRPQSLQGYVVLYMATFIWYVVAIWEGGSNIIGWVPGFVVVYLAWRGSKIAWVIAIVAAAIYLGISATEIQMATAPGGHHPILHVVESVLVLTMLVLLLLPTTRRFYDLDERNAAS
jgi:hypothetical protein